MDRINLTLSEALTGSLTGFAVAGLATGATYGGTITQSGTTLSLSIGETSLATDTGQIPTIAYTGSSLHDSAGNALATFTATNVTDGIIPTLLSRETLDTDGNGKIDSVRLTYSENMNDSLS